MVKNEIKVFARLKPEAKKKNIVNYQIHRRPKKQFEEDYLVLNGAQKSINEYINNRPESWKFAFYKIFDDGIKQDEVFENVAKPVVQSVLNGYNATIFAYGQTGSGKTFSITGDPECYEDRGVLPRTIQYIFEIIQKNPDNLYSVEIAYLEIYNENGYDLLDPKHEVVTKLEDLPRVTIQEDETGTLHLKNLSFRMVENEKDALSLLFLGDTNRAISETPMNPQSSRSHCIFTIAVSVKQSGAQHLTKAKMHLVDLAGSERVYKCCISGTILTEAKHINLSLHYLEQVIVCLGQQNVNHIPYRNSLLTAILRDSLGGNCLTTMLATLSLNTSNFEETISTCRFSQRVALIKNDVNLVLEKNSEDENKFLKIEVERLKNQIAQLSKKAIVGGELMDNEKQDLDFQVNKFIESNETIDWDNDQRKIKYCLQVLRKHLESQNGKKRCVDQSSEDLIYYRNLVVQRDKEISALIKMLQKTKRKSSNNLADDGGSFEALEDRNEISPRMSVIAKKVRLRDLMVEARSIAELIKNGKASIGDLRKRMTDINPVEIQALNKNLQVEQSRLANNLSSLKTLKSEVNHLKIALNNEHECTRIINTDTPPHNDTKKSSTSRIETDSKDSHIDERDNFIPSLISASTSSRKTCESYGTRRPIQPEEPMEISSFIKMDRSGGPCTSVVKNSSDNSLDVRNTGKKIADKNVESNASMSRESKPRTSFMDMNLQEIRNDNDMRRSSIGESLRETKTSPNGESGLSISRAPIFLRNMLQSGGYCGDDLKSLESGRKYEMNIEMNSVPGISELLISDVEIPPTSVQKSMIIDHSPKSNVTNVSKVEKLFQNYKSDVTPPLCDLDCDQSDEFQEGPKKSGSRIQEKIFIPNENLGSNTIAEDLIMSEDDSFIKSLPLTGDPEIDEEIIAFYRAKISGGTY